MTQGKENPPLLWLNDAWHLWLLTCLINIWFWLEKQPGSDLYSLTDPLLLRFIQIPWNLWIERSVLSLLHFPNFCGRKEEESRGFVPLCTWWTVAEAPFLISPFGLCVSLVDVLDALCNVNVYSNLFSKGNLEWTANQRTGYLYFPILTRTFPSLMKWDSSLLLCFPDSWEMITFIAFWELVNKWVWRWSLEAA